MNRKIFPTFLAGALLVVFSPSARSQASEAAQPSPAERGTELAEQGRCGDAMPLIQQAMGQVQDKDLKRRMGVAGLRCAKMFERQGDATSFRAWLEQEFPCDPDIDIGPEQQIASVEICWPRADIQKLSNIAADRLLKIEEARQ